MQQATKDSITKLLELKKAYKEATGQDYKPGSPPAAAAPVAVAAASPGDDIAAQILTQGDVVRELKGKDAKSVSADVFLK